MAEEEKPKLGKGAAFVKSRLKRLPRGDDAGPSGRIRAHNRPVEPDPRP